MTSPIDAALEAGNRRPLAGYAAQHFQWRLSDRVATVTLHRPERLNAFRAKTILEMGEAFERAIHEEQLKRLIATPMKKSDFLLSQILARLAFLGLEVPPVLLSGDHAKIAAWRRQQAMQRTRERRPDLLVENPD